MNTVTRPDRVDISIVVVNWNGRRWLSRCLDSIAEGAAERSVAVLVVDNASTDDSVAFLHKNYPQILAIESPVNLGYARGAQLGIDRARGEFVAVMNPDLVLGPGCLDHLARVLEGRPRAVWVGPKIIRSDGYIQSGPFPLCRVFEPFETTPLIHRFYHPSRKVGHDQVQQCERLSGAVMMFRASFLRALGGLPRSTFLFGEEILLGARCRDHGYEVWYDPLCFALHEHGLSTKQRWDENTRRLATLAGHLSALRQAVSYPRFLAYDLVLLAALLLGFVAQLRERPFRPGPTVRLVRLAASAIFRAPTPPGQVTPTPSSPLPPPATEVTSTTSETRP